MYVYLWELLYHSISLAEFGRHNQSYQWSDRELEMFFCILYVWIVRIAGKCFNKQYLVLLLSVFHFSVDSHVCEYIRMYICDTVIYIYKYTVTWYVVLWMCFNSIYKISSSFSDRTGQTPTDIYGGSHTSRGSNKAESRTSDGNGRRVLSLLLRERQQRNESVCVVGVGNVFGICRRWILLYRKFKWWSHKYIDNSSLAIHICVTSREVSYCRGEFVL
jgi:hypothetical protein